jgi:hypothetical protein
MRDARSNPVRNDSAFREHKPLALRQAIRDMKRRTLWPPNQSLCQTNHPPKSNSAFGEDAVIIDGIAPYRWTGPNAQARWFSDAEKWVHDFGVENETIVCDRIVHATVVGTHAYVVLYATLFFNLKGGQSGSRPGILTFTFVKQVNEWKVESQAWARLS